MKTLIALITIMIITITAIACTASYTVETTNGQATVTTTGDQDGLTSATLTFEK